VRLNPAVRPETHHGLAVGAAGSKFGVLAEDLPRVVDAGRWYGRPAAVAWHPRPRGSQLGAVDAWRSAFRVALATLALQRAACRTSTTVDIGSGFPVDDDPATVPSPARFADEADAVLAETPLDARPLAGWRSSPAARSSPAQVRSWRGCSMCATASRGSWSSTRG
jgi:diaminopimelate decarboxylase